MALGFRENFIQQYSLQASHEQAAVLKNLAVHRLVPLFHCTCLHPPLAGSGSGPAPRGHGHETPESLLQLVPALGVAAACASAPEGLARAVSGSAAAAAVQRETAAAAVPGAVGSGFAGGQRLAVADARQSLEKLSL